MAASQIRRGSQSADYAIAEEEEYYVTRPHTSVRRYKQPVQRDTLEEEDEDQQASLQQWRDKNRPSEERENRSRAVGLSLPARRKRHAPWLAITLGMLVTLALVFGFNAFGSWWQMHQEDVTYGTPRTYQVNAVVGHADSPQNPSHFLFMNLNGHVVIVEFPGGDTTHAMIYSGPTLFGVGSNLLPVTGEFRDVNGDGRLDMLVHIQDQTIVYLNNGEKFVPQQ